MTTTIYNSKEHYKIIQILEQLLFSTAATMDEYRNLDTLDERIKELNIKLLKRRLRNKQKAVTSSRRLRRVQSCHLWTKKAEMYMIISVACFVG